MPKRRSLSDNAQKKSKRLKAEPVGMSIQQVAAQINAAAAYDGKVYRHELDGSYTIVDPDEIFESPDGTRFVISGWR